MSRRIPPALPLANLDDRRADTQWAEGPWLHLPGFCDRVAFEALRGEVTDAALRARRRDLTVPETGYTRRHMSNLSAQQVRELCPLVWQLYTDSAVTDPIRHHTGYEPVPLVDDVEAAVVNYLHVSGDAHGAHLDDHEVAFVLVLEAPRRGDGGELELHLRDSHVEQHDLREGDAYILNAGAVRHAVAPIRSGNRTAIVFAYDLEGRPRPRHSATAALLYG